MKKRTDIKLAFRALRYRNYRLFFSGQLISLIGTWMQTVAQSWLVYRLTGSAALLGLVGFSSQIPVFLLAPVGGTVADRFNRHRIILITQSLSMVLALLLSTLTLSNRVAIWHIFLLSILLGLVNAFDIPARQAFIVDMVNREDLINAVALNSSIFNGARIVGPAVAGILVALIGEGWCFFANGISYLAVLTGLLLMQVEWKPKERKGSPLENIIEGFRFASNTKPIKSLLLILGLVSLSGMPYSVLMPIFADQILHGGPKGLGLLMGASGVGAFIAAISLAFRQSLNGLGNFIAISALSFGVSLILFSLSHSFWLSIILLIPAGYSLMSQMASSNTLIQAMVPDNLRGRVMAIYSMMFMGMAPVGSLLAGSIAQRFGAPITVMGGGFVVIIGAIFFKYQLLELKELAELTELTELKKY